MNSLRKSDKSIFLKAAVLALLPLLNCIIFSLVSGHASGRISLLGSTWNDELFYFKQVEGIIKGGYPFGYFGFNESHALKLSFAAWSPVLAIPWVFFGKIFGWTYISPFIYNCIFYSAALAGLVLLTKPDWKKVLYIAIGYSLFALNARYIYSCMPEVIIWSAMLIFYGTAAGIKAGQGIGNTKGKNSGKNNGKNNGRYATLYIMSVLLTLMRPYLIVMFLLPLSLAFLERGRKRKAGLLAAGCGAGLFAVVIYALISRFLTAKYFTSIYNTAWLHAFKNEGFASGLRETGKIFASIGVKSLDVFYRIKLAFTVHQPDGAFYLLQIMIIIIFTVSGLILFKRRKIREALVWTHFALAALALLLAVMLLYKPVEGSKHLLTFIVPGIILLPFIGKKEYVRIIPIAVVCIILLYVKLPGYGDFVLPHGDSKTVESFEYWEECFDRELVLDKEKKPSYDNTVIWVYNDTVNEDGGETVVTSDWQMLYAVPEGFGINCCMGDYVYENSGSINSKYICTVSGGRLDEYFAGSESWVMTGRNGDLVLYIKK